MCVICHIPKDKTIDTDRVTRLWDRNSDGGGLAYVSRRGNIVVEKTMDKDTYLDQVRRVQSFRHRSDLLLHMRIATHGSVSLPNVHPFRVNEPQGRDDLVMAHNGIISKVAPKKPSTKAVKAGEPAPVVDDRSDTRVFIEDVVNDLPMNWLDNPAIVRMVGDFIGGSKLTFLSTRPELRHSVYIINEHLGTERDGIWFSNNYGVDEPKKYTTPTYAGAWESDGWSAGGWSRKGQPPTQHVGTVSSRNLTNWWQWMRREWDRWYQSASEQQVHEMVVDFQTIERDRRSGFFSENTIDAFEYDGRKWVCLSCYHTIDIDLKYGYTDCGCYDHECLECDEECFRCRCNLRPTVNSVQTRRVRKHPTPPKSKVTSLVKKGGDVGSTKKR